MNVPVTWLYVPGDRPERFDKAVASGADVVIIDLEDAVAPARKDEARANAVAYLRGRRARDEARANAVAYLRGRRASDSRERSATAAAAGPAAGDLGGGGALIHVRVNDLATGRGRADLEAVGGMADAVRVPKVETAGVLDGLGPVPAYALLESAAGIVNARDIAAHPRVAGVALGEQDLAAELSITDESAMNHLRLQVVLAAAAAGLPPVPMSVYPNVKDEAGLVASCRAGRALGLFGRTAIHPRQIPVIRRAFRPTDEETAAAAEIVEAAERAAQTGTGAIALPDGRFADAPIVARARRVLALAQRLSS